MVLPPAVGDEPGEGRVPHPASPGDSQMRALDEAPCPVVVFDDAGRIHLVSRAWREAGGDRSAQPARIEDWAARACGDQSASFLLHLREAVRGGASVQLPEIIVTGRNGGRRRWALAVSALSEPWDGQRVFMGIAHDRGDESPPAVAEAGHLRALLEALPAAVYTTDAEGRVTYYNDAAAVLWGYRPALGGTRWCGSWRLFWPDGRFMPHDTCPMAIALKENRPVRNAEAIVERPDGTRVPMLPFPTPLRDESGALVGAVNLLVDISERKTAELALRDSEARARLLAREVDHRAKNMLAVVHAIARMTSAASVPAYVEALSGRLVALARAQTALSESAWAGADLGRLIAAELAAHEDVAATDRVTASGPAVVIGAEAAQGVAITIHELTTNALAHGALSVPEGRVTIDWRRAPDGGFVLTWRERGGPRPAAPAKPGFGLTLVETAVERQVGGGSRLEWDREGLLCRLTVPGGASSAVA